MRQIPDELLVAHSSDLHIDDPALPGDHDGLGGLRAVLGTAQAAGADLLLLVGDVFDNNRVGADTLRQTAALLEAAGTPVVILPGNHDPAVPGGVYHRSGIAALPNVCVLGLTQDEAIVLPALGLEVRGRAHRDYDDMVPLRPAPPRSTRWRITMVHGHFEWRRDRANPLRPSWLVSEDEIADADADYVALGHWDRPAPVGAGDVPAYYSGSPEFARTINLIRLGAGVSVTRQPLIEPARAATEPLARRRA